MLVHRLDQLLAQADPFDLAQAIEAHVCSLSGRQIRALVSEAKPRMSAYYRVELQRILDLRGEMAQRNALITFLKSNLRAIALFGPSFGRAILNRVPIERAVGIGEEVPNRGMRAAVVAGIALALVVAGAAGEHIVAGARMASQTPEPYAAVVPPAVVPTLTPLPATPAPHTARPSPSPAATPHPATPPPPTVAPSTPPQTPGPAPTPARRVTPAPPSPSSGRGVATVIVPSPTPSPEPSDLDIDGMPESYSDATPLPEQSAGEVTAPAHGINVVTPKPSPKPHGWLHRSIMHLDPFKPHPKPT